MEMIFLFLHMQYFNLHDGFNAPRKQIIQKQD